MTWAHLRPWTSWQIRPVGQLAAEPLPSSQWPMPRGRRPLTHGWYAAPIQRPIIPFEAAQQVATLPQPPHRPFLRTYLRHPAGVLPPLSMVLPVAPLGWEAKLPTLPVRRPPVPTRPQVLGFWPLPIPPLVSPEIAWQGRYPDWLGRRLPLLSRLPTAYGADLAARHTRLPVRAVAAGARSGAAAARDADDWRGAAVD